MAGGTQEEDMPGSEEEVDDAEERHIAMARKRKGKKVATPQPGKSKRISSVKEAEAPHSASRQPPTQIPSRSPSAYSISRMR